MDPSEQALIRAAARGDESAFTELLHRHRERVYRVARRTVGDHATAEDIAQQVFITMHAKLHTFRGGSKLSTWLYRITMNRCYDHLRRERPQAELDFAQLPDPRPDATSALNTEEVQQAVNAHIMELPPKQRMTLTLRLHEELSFKEIAEAMGCTANTAKVNYHHAIRRLRERLQAKGPGCELPAM